MRSVAAEYLGRYVPGVYVCRFKLLYGVITLRFDVSPYLVLGAAFVSRMLVSL